jgi:hypothetical protein
LTVAGTGMSCKLVIPVALGNQQNTNASNAPADL